jgi:hypothetical protein
MGDIATVKIDEGVNQPAHPASNELSGEEKSWTEASVKKRLQRSSFNELHIDVEKIFARSADHTLLRKFI